MLLLTKIIKYFGYLLIALFGGYLLFPAWASWLISANLPGNMTLIDFESDYPGFKQISIKRLVLMRGEQQFSLEDLRLDYDLSDIQLHRLTVELIGQNTTVREDVPLFAQLSDLRLPEISAKDFAPLLRLQRVAIAEMSVIGNKQIFHFSQLELARREPTNFALKMSMLHPLNERAVDLEFILGLNEQANEISLQVTNNEAPLIWLSHQQTDHQTTIGLSFNSQNIQSLLVDQLSNFPIKTKENIEIHWLQDKSAKLVKIKIKTLLEIFPEAINFSEISIQPHGNDQLDKSVGIPFELSLNTKLDEPSNAKIKLSGSMDRGLKIKYSDGLIKLGPAKFNIATTLAFDNSVKQLGFTNSRIDLSGVDFMFDRQQSNMKIAEYRLDAVAQNIQLNLDDLVNTRWQFKGVFSSPEVVGTLIKQDFKQSASLVSAESNQSDNANTLRLDSQIEVNFEVVKTDNIVSSGELLLSRLQVIDLNYQLKGPLEFNWQSVQSDLTQGSAALVYDSRQNQVVGFDFDSLKVEANLSLDGHQIEGAGKLSINQQDLAPFSFKFDKTASRLMVDLKKNQLANQIFNHFLAAIGKQNKMALEILAGEVVHSAGVGIDKLLLLDSELAITDMLLQFDNNQVQGLNVAQKLTSLEPLVLQTHIDIDKIAFASGLSIDNFSASVSSRSIEDISLHSVKADLLEGHLIADKLQIGTNNLTRLPFQLKQISLTELIFLIDIPGLYGEGKLDFYLPLSLESGSVTVDEGHFKATEKGIIKYISGQEDSGVEENIALQALKNFHYDELDGTLSYNKAGEYHIRLHLLGANPDLYNGYPVDFVLNLRGELSGIFRSLFLTGNFEEAVLQQVKAEQVP